MPCGHLQAFLGCTVLPGDCDGKYFRAAAAGKLDEPLPDEMADSQLLDNLDSIEDSDEALARWARSFKKARTQN